MPINELPQAIHTSLNMLGSAVRKSMVGSRTTYFREWRSRDNSWLGVVTVFGVIALFVCIMALAG